MATQQQLDRENQDAEWIVDEIVVNGEDDQHRVHGSEKGTTTRQTESDAAGSVHRGYGAGTGDSPDSHFHPEGPVEYFRYRIWPAIIYFFYPRFEDQAKELDFQKYQWYANKRLAFFASLFLYLNWVLYLILNQSVSTYEKWTFYLGLSLFTLPVPFLVAMNINVSNPVTFQVLVTIAAWYCGITEVIQMRQCDFFTVNNCDNKDFLAMTYYNTALPILLMFIATHRLPNFIMFLIVFILLWALLIPVQGIFTRVVIAFGTFWAFMLGLHYAKEMTDRRMHLLNSQLKVAYRAQQKAQIAESKANQAKRRFASYIFHEVRVPLNTAMLAFQNLQSNNAFRDAHVENQGIEIYALDASLSMMQQVLNDVLDLERMEYGRFESTPRPYPLHRAIHSIMGPVGLASAAKRLELKIDLDPAIDTLQIPLAQQDGLWVIGDEIRLRQVLTNLASNAVKFTPDGGGAITVKTILLRSSLTTAKRSPSLKDKGKALREMERDTPAAVGTHEKEMDPMSLAGVRLDSGASLVGEERPTVTFRLEVHDCGPGIRPSDLVEHRLFQPFVQTAVGKMRTGLGLAIVRQIVTLSGGRLGVQSRKGKGAIFWTEFTLRIATAAEVRAARSAGTPIPTPPVPRVMPPPERGLGHFADRTEHPLAYAKEQGAEEKQQELPVPKEFVHPSAVAGSQGETLPVPLALVRQVPLADVPPATPPQQRASTTPVQGRSPTDPPLSVLVVDDDALTRSLMSRMLVKLGCTVETANDGEQFLELLLEQGRTFDLVCLDNFMPRMTGEEAVQKLRAAGRTDLILGCTGNALTEDQTAYIDAGADQILTKPIMIKDLKAVLQAAAQRRAEKQRADS